MELQEIKDCLGCLNTKIDDIADGQKRLRDDHRTLTKMILAEVRAPKISSSPCKGTGQESEKIMCMKGMKIQESLDNRSTYECTIMDGRITHYFGCEVIPGSTAKAISTDPPGYTKY